MLKKFRQSGVTLPEMMTAVAITLIMLSASGMIFRAASKSSGKAIALNDMMSQMRMITAQLDNDLAGFRGELPFGIIFEGYNNLDGTFERRDRVFFFSNGNWEDMQTGSKSDLARIFYGQSEDTYPNLNTDDLLEIPKQRFLARKLKLMSSVSTSPTDLLSDGIDWFDYDMYGLEYGPDSYWKNAIAGYFDVWLYEDVTQSYDLKNNIISLVRRPYIGDPLINGAGAKYYVNDNGLADDLAASLVEQYKQNIYMLDDVTDFSVQIWWRPPGETQARWYPNDNDLANYISLNGTAAYFGVGMNLNSSSSPANMWINTLKLVSGEYLNYGSLNVAPLDYIKTNYMIPLPQALKFSFKLHDANRQHFPEGKYFEYIVKLTKD